MCLDKIAIFKQTKKSVDVIGYTKITCYSKLYDLKSY